MDSIIVADEREDELVSGFVAAVAPVATATLQFFMILGAPTVFLPQYLAIRRTRNADGFSLYVCLALTVAGILRITFWFGHPYEIPLLLQSIVMVLMMLALVQLCTDVKNKQDLMKDKRRMFSDFDLRHFWDWTDFSSYLQCVTSMSLTCLMLMYYLNVSVLFVETVGFLSLLIEAMLAVPQFLKNRQKKSTHGMSILTVFFMTAGDVIKTFYFIVRQAPPQFWLCGFLQLWVDFCIWCQVWLYRHGTEARRKRDSLLR